MARTRNLHSHVAATLTVALLAAGAATAHTDHLEADRVVATARELDRTAAAFQARLGNGARISALPGPDAHLVGSWSGPQAWPLAPQNAALLTDGRVFAYESAPPGTHGQQSTPAMIWDPSSGATTRVDSTTGYNLFCSGFAHLPNGRIFMAGGDFDYSVVGIPQTHLFSPDTSTWTLGPNMSQGERWYPGVTPLPNGEMLIAEGGPESPEVRQTDGSLRPLTGIDIAMSGREYPWLQVAPSGRTIFMGPRPNMFSLETAGAGSEQFAGNRDSLYRSYGTYATYDVGKVLVVGGGNSLASARVIDINGAAPVVSPTGSLAVGRRQLTATVLPDGSVLATGGLSSGAEFVDLAAATRNAELWNPTTGAWTTLAAEATPRQYHSIALLLPDGRVLSAAGGVTCGACVQAGYLARNADVFSPPYLFKQDGSGELAPRPAIVSAPAALGYGQVGATVATPDAESIQKVALIRVSSVTHSVNGEQNYIPLTFTAGVGGLTVNAPANANIAPPGHYMLFLINAAGVPSVASIVELGATGTPAAPGAPTLLTATPGNRRVTLAWSATPGATGYTVRYGPVGSATETSVDAGPTTSFPVNGLVNGSPYRFVVSARNGGGQGLGSNELTATPATQPGTPTLAVPVVGDRSVTLSWTATPGATSYTVRRGTSPGLYTSETAVGAVESMTVTGLVNGTAYYFAVAALTSSGLSADSNEQVATPNNPPAQPTLNPPSAGNGQVSLSWSAVFGATGYVLRWGTSPGTFFAARAVTSTATTVTGLVNGTIYYFSLVATSPAGASIPSSERAATPTGSPATPAVPVLAPLPTVAIGGLSRGTGRGLLGQYFPNARLAGRPALSRVERIDFRWGTGSPSRKLPRNGFSVRWSGRVEAPTSGVYRLSASGDDVVRVWIGSRLVLDTQARRSNAAEARLTWVAGRRYRIRVEYRERSGRAEARLLWREPGRSRARVIARSRLYEPVGTARER